MKLLIIYSDSNCGCTIKCCFELGSALKKYIDTTLLNYKELSEEVIKQYDMIIFQRLGANAVHIEQDEKKFLIDTINKYKKEKIFIYLIDDLVLKDQDGFPKELIKNCYATFCSSQMLARYIGRINPRVYTFHTFIDTEALSVIKPNQFSKFTMTWASTGGLGKNIIKGILENKKKYGLDFDLIIVGGREKEFRRIEEVKTYPIMPLKNLISIIKGSDILLNPMVPDEEYKMRLEKRTGVTINDFIDAKAEIKYAIAGIINACLITSPIERYASVIKNGENGIMVGDTVEKWMEAIKYLYNDRAKRQEITSNAYKHVKREYDQEAVASIFAQTLLKIKSNF